MGRWVFARAVAFALIVATLPIAAPAHADAAAPASPLAACTNNEGPGITPPAGLPAGVPGFLAQWYGPSGYPPLCPGPRSTAQVAYYTSGVLGRAHGRLGAVPYR